MGDGAGQGPGGGAEFQTGGGVSQRPDDSVSQRPGGDEGRQADRGADDQPYNGADERMGALEALLFIATEPMPLATLAEAIGASQAETQSMLRAIAEELASGPRPRGFELRQAGGGWRMYTNPEYADVLAAHVASEHSGRLSAPALETLAVVAYRQPVTRGQIAAIRGVNVDSVVRTLVTRGLIGEVGTSESTGAVLYGTTPYFLEAMGMNGLEELEPLAPYLPDATELDDVAKELP